MATRIVEWQLPYTWWTGIGIDWNKVISLLLREENNLIMVNDDNQVYTDLQLEDGLTPNSDFPVWVTVWKILQADWWTKSGLLLNWKTTSGDYARWIYSADGKIYFDWGTGTWKQVYYSTEVDQLIQNLQTLIDNTYQQKLTAGDGIRIENNVISTTNMSLWKFLSLWDCSTWMPISFPFDTPYEYTTWDYFLIEVVDNSLNYRPTGSSYTGTASGVVETDEVQVWDVYIYDWAIWLLQSNWWKSVSFANIAGQPTDNTALANALNAKQNVLTAWQNIDISNNKISTKWIEVEVASAVATVAKVWTTTTGNYTPTKWDFLLLNFINGNTATNPTLNIDWSGAKQIRSGWVQVTNLTWALWSDAKVLVFYDGTYYNGYSVKDTNTTYQPMGVPEWQTGTATSNRVMRADYLKQIIDYHASNLDNKIRVVGWEGIEVKYNDYSAMQWPCPEWFHVPSRTEYEWLKTILTTLGITTWTWIITALKMPLAWYIDYNRTDCAVLNTGIYGRYWTADEAVIQWVYDRAYSLAINVRSWEDTYSATWYGRKTWGNSIRAFKDEYVEPTSSRTVISGTLWSAGIFWNTTDWLITITNWTSWYTIQDKNLWATTVYNYWDTLSEANCGKYYQWWNSYWFRWIGSSVTVQTSSTQVDTTGYWPRNTYSSDVYIIGFDDWSNPSNSNIWWWVTGVVNTVNNEWVTSINWQIWDFTAWKNISISNNVINTKMIEVTVDTAYNVVAKIWTTAAGNYTPEAWDILLVTFTNGCNANSPTLNIDWSWAYNIRLWSTNATSTTFNLWSSSVKAMFYYDGNYYKAWSVSNTTYSVIPESEITWWTSANSRLVTASRLKTAIEYWGKYTSATAPTSPIEWALWYDTTNDVLKSYDWSQWNEVGWGEECNTKTFYLSGTSDLTNAQAAYDWHRSWKNAILTSSSVSNHRLFFEKSTVNWEYIWSYFDWRQTSSGTWWSTLWNLYEIKLTVSSNTVTNISGTNWNTQNWFLNKNNTTAYTPSWDYNPATKKYVDDSVAGVSATVVSGDSGVTYTIKVSNSDPSGAPSTTITLVP